MTRHVNAWTAQGAWLLIIGILGVLLVPQALSIANLGMFALMGSAVLVGAFGLWSAHQPSVSTSQARVAVEAAEAAARRP